GVLQLRGGLGQVDAALGEVQGMRPVATSGLLQRADRLAGSRLFGQGVMAEAGIVGKLVQAAAQAVDVVLACLRGTDQGQRQACASEQLGKALHGWPPGMLLAAAGSSLPGIGVPSTGAESTEAEGAGMSPTGNGAEESAAGAGIACSICCCRAASCSPSLCRRVFSCSLPCISARAAPSRALTRASSASAPDSSARFAASANLRAAIASCACWNLSCAKPRSTGA